MKWFILLTILTAVYGKPQRLPNNDDAAVEKEETPVRVTFVPFYGGGKGQSLQILEYANGTMTTNIIQTPEEKPIGEEVINAAELENPPLPSKQDSDYKSNIQNIHNNALKVIKLQDRAKEKGELTRNEEELYRESMDSINLSAKNLADLQDDSSEFDFENREGLSAWFERKKSTKKDKDKRKEEENKKKKEEEKKREEEKQKEQEKKEEERRKEEEKKKKEENKRKGEKEEEEEEEEIEENEEDGIIISLPPDDASVAEAKPVGLAVAGEGGVAASKPIATAVVGPGGLAIARPVGTAIAGVSPDQALVPIYAEGYIAGSKPKRSGSASAKKPDAASEYLNRIISKYHQN